MKLNRKDHENFDKWAKIVREVMIFLIGFILGGVICTLIK